jgi:hypothetical protein
MVGGNDKVITNWGAARAPAVFIAWAWEWSKVSGKNRVEQKEACQNVQTWLYSVLYDGAI